MKLNGYRDLEVWQMGRTLVKLVYEFSATLPKDEKYGLIDQIRRSAVSIPANIAEGWGRNSNPSLAQFAKIARGSMCELETLLLLAQDLGLSQPGDLDEIEKLIVSLGSKLYRFIQSVSSTVREHRRAYPTYAEQTQEADEDMGARIWEEDPD